MARIAHQAWESEKKGEMEIDGHPVRKDGKIVLVSQETYEGKRFMTVAFPRPIHMPDFARAAEGTDIGGPARSNPEGIGTLAMNRMDSDIAFSRYRPAPTAVQRFPHVWMLHMAQAHFKTKSQSSQRPTLSRTRATQYLGWRQRAMNEALRHCQKTGIPLAIEKATYAHEWLLAQREDGSESPWMKEIQQVAQENGWMLSENNHFIVLHPPKSSE